MELTINEEILDMLVNTQAVEAARAAYFRDAGISAGKNIKRAKLEQEFGYPSMDSLSFTDFYKAYRRMAPAYAAVNRLLDQCWVDNPVVIDGLPSREATESTDWEIAATQLLIKFRRAFKEADKRGLVGRFSVLFLQLKDGKDWGQPVDIASLKKSGAYGLSKLIPAWEGQVSISKYDQNPLSPTYGEPLEYTFNETEVSDSSNSAGRNLTVHRDRVLLFCESAESSDPTSGMSMLEPGYNKLLDLIKVSGGSAEGFLKNASRQLALNLSKEVNVEKLAARAKEQGYADFAQALEAKLARMSNGVDSTLITQEGQASVLSVTPGDPSNSWMVNANEFAASVRIPFTILFGQQTGRLASDEDKKDWANRGNERRNNFLTEILREFLERMISYGILPPNENENISITWSDLLAPSEKEKIANARELAVVAETSMRAYGQAAITPNEIRAAMELEALKPDELPPNLLELKASIEAKYEGLNEDSNPSATDTTKE